jgi:hyperosmotically inducible periplasmic protein
MPIKHLSILALAAMLALGVACNDNKKVTNLDPDTVKNAEKQAGYNDVDVKVDKDKGVVTLSGKVQSQDAKDKALDVAKGVTGDLVVANEISVQPQGVESEARSIESNIDDAIEHNFKAVLVSHRMDKDIHYDSKNGVLTLKGDVANTKLRQQAEKLAASVPNVSQVVNELEVKGKNSERAATD